MTTAAPQRSSASSKEKLNYHPDDFRMTVGEHLEELRTRMVLGLVGFVAAAIVCFIFGDRVVWYFCRPLMNAMAANGFSPQVYISEATESFMVYIKISMVTAGALASPWLLYQLWLFVAAGLFPHERKYITKYLPLSIFLLVIGMVFLYLVVLPLMLRFFVGFNIGPGIHFMPSRVDASATHMALPKLPILAGDPPKPTPGDFWYDASQHRLKFCLGTIASPEIRVIPYGSAEMVTPQITLGAYIDMVLGLLLSFGLAFQTPLVVLTLVRIGIFDVEQLKAMRRYVYFAVTIIAGFIVPDVVGGMIALMIPLMLLFELGLWLAREPGQSTGLRPWVKARWASLRESIRTRGLGASFKKPLSWAGTLLLIALIIHVMARERMQPTPVTPATTRPATTAPATTAPATTRPVATEPATTRPAATEPAEVTRIETRPVAATSPATHATDEPKP